MSCKHTTQTDAHTKVVSLYTLSRTLRAPHAHRRPTLCRIGIIHHILQLTAFYLSWVILHPGSVTGTRHRQLFWQPAFCVLEDAPLGHHTLAFIVWVGEVEQRLVVASWLLQSAKKAKPGRNASADKTFTAWSCLAAVGDRISAFFPTSLLTVESLTDGFSILAANDLERKGLIWIISLLHICCGILKVLALRKIQSLA